MTHYLRLTCKANPQRAIAFKASIFRFGSVVLSTQAAPKFTTDVSHCHTIIPSGELIIICDIYHGILLDVLSRPGYTTLGSRAVHPTIQARRSMAKRVMTATRAHEARPVDGKTCTLTIAALCVAFPESQLASKRQSISQSIIKQLFDV